MITSRSWSLTYFRLWPSLKIKDSVVNPDKLNLDPEHELWPKFDPDRDPDPRLS